MKPFMLRHSFIALLCVFSAIACGREYPRSALPGALAKPIAQYSGDEFQEFVNTLRYTGGQERARKCAKDPSCAGAKRTVVHIDAIASEDSLGPSNAPKNGVVYARIINKGNAEEARYGMAPGRQFEYFMIISADSARGMTWQLEQLDTTPNARRHVQIGTGVFQSCHHTWLPGARADFRACDYQQRVGKDSNAVPALLRAQLHEDAPIWFGCAEGCCTAAPAGSSLR